MIWNIDKLEISFFWVCINLLATVTSSDDEILMPKICKDLTLSKLLFSSSARETAA